MLPQFINDLIHLERRGNRLNQTSRANRASTNVEQILGHAENVVPEARFEVVLHFREAVGRGRGLCRERSASTSALALMTALAAERATE